MPSRPPPPAARTPGDPDAVRAVRLEVLIARLVAQQTSGQIAYWAAFRDAGGTSHFAFVVDPAYAPLSAENAARRASADAALERAIERYRATLAGLRSAR